ncbi:hypothetical protein HRK28_07315 [Rathayibacter sp. VKM Ac-2835]|uniref:hypothetical protein n=1 Tax=Rathayibacter sp. VKM Ac-2835 TaxID=2739043 RepID=UPI001564BD63|nr:hypothetical protein [Rathayibacter sp. VKM Ac-2835]NRG40731.1 hypothetical protein [Rathayibacter sp. VKM Ac-2835]
MTDTDSAPVTASRGLSRRSVTAAAWTVPVVAVAVGTPAAAASAGDVGAFVLAGRCAVPGIRGPGFTLTAGSGDLPAGTRIVITGRGVANIGTFRATPEIASIEVLSGTARVAVLTSPLTAGATVSLITTLSSTVRYGLAAMVELIDGTVGTGSKNSASVEQSVSICSAG